MSTTPERNARHHHAAAILAIAQHVVDHGLPAPASIDTHDATDITVWLMVHELPAWLATVQLEEATTEPPTTDQHGLTYRTRRMRVRLPNLGIGFQLRTAGTFLQLHATGDEQRLWAHAEDWHRTCASDDCATTVCLQAPHDPADPAAEACEHGYCLEHAAECVTCARQDRADARF